jgi:hypothetical protein
MQTAWSKQGRVGIWLVSFRKGDHIDRDGRIILTFITHASHFCDSTQVQKA